MKNGRRIFMCLAAWAAVWLIVPVVLAQGPVIIGPNGEYLGNYNSNQFDQNSIANPYGPYGNPYGNTVKNPYSIYGNPYGPSSVNNPFAVGGNGPRVLPPVNGYGWRR